MGSSRLVFVSSRWVVGGSGVVVGGGRLAVVVLDY